MVSVSAGYFIYDFLDMMANQKLSQSWELLFHHLVVGLSSSTVRVRNTHMSKVKYIGQRCLPLALPNSATFHVTLALYHNPSSPVKGADMGKRKYPSFLSSYQEQVREEHRDNHSSLPSNSHSLPPAPSPAHQNQSYS